MIIMNVHNRARLMHVITIEPYHDRYYEYFNIIVHIIIIIIIINVHSYHANIARLIHGDYLMRGRLGGNMVEKEAKIYSKELLAKPFCIPCINNCGHNMGKLLGEGVYRCFVCEVELLGTPFPMQSRLCIDDACSPGYVLMTNSVGYVLMTHSIGYVLMTHSGDMKTLNTFMMNVRI
eukprot:g6533.t1